MVGSLSLTAAGKLAVVDGRRRARMEIGARRRVEREGQNGRGLGD